MDLLRLIFKAAISIFLGVVLILAACASPGKIEKRTPEAAAAVAWRTDGRFLTLHDARIFYLDSDSGRDGAHKTEPRAQAAPIILIHGLGASTFSYRRNFEALAAQARVVALDLKGFGFSKQFEDKSLTFRTHADVVLALMDALKISRATLVGHSLGGTIAMQVAARHPERVDRLVLIDSATLYITRPFITRLLHGKVFNALAYQFGGPSRNRVRQLLLRSYYDKSRVTEVDVDGYYLPFTVKNSAESLRLFLTTPNPNDNALAARITAPTLILWGAHDDFLELSVRNFLHQQIKNSKLVVIEGAGHAVMEEKPEEVNQAILRFVSERKGGP